MQFRLMAQKESAKRGDKTTSQVEGKDSANAWRKESTWPVQRGPVWLGERRAVRTDTQAKSGRAGPQSSVRICFSSCVPAPEA